MSAIQYWCHRHFFFFFNGALPLAMLVQNDFSGVARKTTFYWFYLFLNFLRSSSSTGCATCLVRRHNHSETDEVHTLLKYACNYGGLITQWLYTATCLSVEAASLKLDYPGLQSQPCCLSFDFWGMSSAGAFSAISRTGLNDWPNLNLGRSAKNSVMPCKCTSAGS